MPYLAQWSVFVVGDEIADPVAAAVRAREMADEHFRSLWGVEDTETGDYVTVDVVKREIVPVEKIETNTDEAEQACRIQ